MCKAEYELIEIYDRKTKIDLCDRNYDCPRVDNEMIDCPDCPAYNDEKKYTYDEAKKIMEDWKKAQEE